MYKNTQNLPDEILEIEREQMEIEIRNELSRFCQEIDWENSPPSLNQLLTIGITTKTSMLGDLPDVEHKIHFNVQDKVDNSSTMFGKKLAFTLSEKDISFLRTNNKWDSLNTEEKQNTLKNILKPHLTIVFKNMNTYKMARVLFTEFFQSYS